MRLFKRRMQNNIPPSLIPYHFDSHVFWPGFSFLSQKHHHNIQDSKKTQSFEELKCKLTHNPLEIIGFRLSLRWPGPSHLRHSCWNRKESLNAFALLHLSYVPRLTHCEKLNWSLSPWIGFAAQPWLPNGVNEIFFFLSGQLHSSFSPHLQCFILAGKEQEKDKQMNVTTC